MKYGILINNAPAMAPNPLCVNGFQIYNPRDAQYAAAGYLPIVETPCPVAAEDDEGKYYTASWEEREGRILCVWNEAEVKEPAVGKRTLEERVSAVEASTAELSANLELLIMGSGD